ncbi:MAG: tRNA (guanosine(18)-2'-O)-methyltransferase TrmH [Deltaproteobacteria bacterium]|nr:tRNA (guanosine(18)-2'-O)-methyltransferase TrmH [Candidatus Anaeroferrophillus wilburensis]MBN2887934.1 tRNA (guanosine(18)-2'-O)-methyltransferase TrmH [Deltaproteobacteria bacterium]
MNNGRFQRLAAVLQRRQPDLTVVMDNVHKPHNLAAIARTCDAVGILTAHAVAKNSSIRLTQKAASGCSKWVAVHAHYSIIDAYNHLRSQNFQILATHFDERSVDFRDIDYTRPTAIVVGAELDGISPAAVAHSDRTIIIPMAGLVQSLNVSVATALILFEAQRQRQAAGFYDIPRLPENTYNRLLFEWYHPKIASYCQRRGLPYPAINENGDLMESLADRPLSTTGAS